MDDSVGNDVAAALSASVTPLLQYAVHRQDTFGCVPRAFVDVGDTELGVGAVAGVDLDVVGLVGPVGEVLEAAARRSGPAGTRTPDVLWS